MQQLRREGSGQSLRKLLKNTWEKLNSLCDKLTLPHFSPSDLQYLEMYMLAMKPIAKALNFLQGENHINYDVTSMLHIVRLYSIRAVITV